MNRESAVVSETSQTEKDRNSMLSLMCGIKNEKGTNITKQKQTCRYRWATRWWLQVSREGREAKMGEGSQIDGNRWKLRLWVVSTQ